MHKALHPRDDVDRQKEEEDLPVFKMALIQKLKDYIKKHKGRLITVTRNKIDNTSINRTKVTRKQKW